jgi:hypothetical protein
VVLGQIGASGFKPPQKSYVFNNTIISKEIFEPKACKQSKHVPFAPFPQIAGPCISHDGCNFVLSFLQVD